MYTYDISSVCKPFKQEDLKEGRLHLCIYFANTTLSTIFLQYILYKYTDGPLKDQLIIPYIEYSKKHSLENHLRKFFSKVFDQSIEEHSIDIKGLLGDNYLFIDMSEFIQYYKERRYYIGFLKNSSTNWWNVTLYEIMNLKHIYHYPIHESVTSLFIQHPDLLALKKKNRRVEHPKVVYNGYSYNRCLFVSIFGKNKSFSHAKYGPYYYFSDYAGAVQYALMAQERGANRVGIVRSILFTNKKYIVLNNPSETPVNLSILTKLSPTDQNRLSRIYKPYGEWGEKYDTLFVYNPILDNGKSLGEVLNIVVVNSDNSAVLNWAELDTSRITKKWSQEDKYYIK